MSLVHVVDMGLQVETAQKSDTADTKQHFLQKTCLSISHIEVGRDLAVLGRVFIYFAVQKIERNTAYLHFPDSGVERTAWQVEVD